MEAAIGVTVLVIFYVISYALGTAKATFNNFLAEAFDALINSIMS